MMGAFVRPRVRQTAPTSPVKATHVTPLRARKGTTRATTEEHRHGSLHSRAAESGPCRATGWPIPVHIQLHIATCIYLRTSIDLCD